MSELQTKSKSVPKVRMASATGLDLAAIPKRCINLKRRPDRWADFLAQPGTARFAPIERYEAIDAKGLDVTKDPNVAVQVLYNIMKNERRSHHEIVSAGSIACYYSHTNLWKWLLTESDAPAMLIMEDDLEITPDSYDALQALLNDPVVAGGDWGIFNPGAYTGAKEPLSPAICEYKRSFLFHCYIITRKGAETLLKTAFPIQMHVDHYASFVAAVGRTRIIGPCKRLFKQRDDKSDNRTDFQCTICNVPTLENPKHGRYVKTTRARVYELEESILVVGALLVGLYIWKKRA
jgi:GR25 family glycosyltransferase involved in LPS biosynthesis